MRRVGRREKAGEMSGDTAWPVDAPLGTGARIRAWRWFCPVAGAVGAALGSAGARGRRPEPRAGPAALESRGAALPPVHGRRPGPVNSWLV